MDIEEYLKLLFLGDLLLHVWPYYLDFSQSTLLAFWVIVSEEATIHISALCIGSIISNDDTIRVYDRRHPKLKLISHFLWYHMPWRKVVDEPVDDEGWMGLACVLPPNDEDDWLFIVFALLILVRDLEDGDVHSTIGCSHRFKSDELVIYTTTKTETDKIQNWVNPIGNITVNSGITS